MESAVNHLEELFFDGNGEDNARSSSPVFGITAKCIPKPPDIQNLSLSQGLSKPWKPEAAQNPTHATSVSGQKPGIAMSSLKSLSNVKKKDQGSPLVGIVAPSQLVRKERVSHPVFKVPSNQYCFGRERVNREQKDSVATATDCAEYLPGSEPRLSVSKEKPDLCNSQEDMVTSQQHPDAFSFMPSSFTISSMTPRGTRQEVTKLKSVEEVPVPYRNIFHFPFFNIVQSKVFDDVFYSDKAVIVCAPTGSGKTVIFELAIIRLQLTQHGHVNRQSKVVYMAPIKSLCSERCEDWKLKFSPLGLTCLELTGDSEIDYLFDLENVHIILTTPEKWDSMTRRWRNNKSMVQNICLFLIDEVHSLNDESRGATMEAVISRMKTVHTELTRTGTKTGSIMKAIRFVAVSATVPNVQDLGDWLGSENEKAATYNMDESYRPVHLRKIVLGYPCPESQSEFRFDLSLNYKLATVIQTYSDQRPTLVFCATRKGTMQAANILIKDTRFIINAQHKQRLQKTANAVKDSKLRELILYGIAFHHAGLEAEDRKLVEASFICGDIAVLFSTSTLAMGVNLPAHLVVIKSTEHYVMGTYQEYTETQILQMIGRAGRPQFDSTATAVIMTKTVHKAKYENLLSGNQMIESSLHLHLTEHLNAEIVLNTIKDVSVALEWAKSTFLYIRMLKNPKYYGLCTELSKEKVEQHLQDLCLKNLNALACFDLIRLDEDLFMLNSTETGHIMARYCISFETMKNFYKITGTESLEELILILCQSQEFCDIQLRVTDKKTLNKLNRDKQRQTIRFQMKGKIKTREMKVNCLIQAQLGCLTIDDFSLQQDINKINRASLRVVQCLVQVLWQRGDQFTALLNAVILAKCMKAHLWEQSKYVTKQLSGIGIALANALVNAGITSFEKVEEKNPRDIELVVNRHPPFGKQIKDAVAHLPKYDLYIDQLNPHNTNSAELYVRIKLANADILHQKATAGKSHTCVLIIGDVDNKVVYKAKISDAMLLGEGSWCKKFEVRRSQNGDELSINLISQEWVGLDVQGAFNPTYVNKKQNGWIPRDPEKKTKMIKETAVSTLTGSDCSGFHQNNGSEPEPNFDLVMDNETADSVLDQFRRPCSHNCKNKALCSHTCCKKGVTHSERKTTMMDRYRQQLKHKLEGLTHTPDMKCRKVIPNLQQYSYTPQHGQRLPGICKLLAATPKVTTSVTYNKPTRRTHMLPARQSKVGEGFDLRHELATEWNYDMIHQNINRNVCTSSAEVIQPVSSYHEKESTLPSNANSGCPMSKSELLLRNKTENRFNIATVPGQRSSNCNVTLNNQDLQHRLYNYKPEETSRFSVTRHTGRQDHYPCFQMNGCVRSQQYGNIEHHSFNTTRNIGFPISRFGYVAHHTSLAAERSKPAHATGMVESHAHDNGSDQTKPTSTHAAASVNGDNETNISQSAKLWFRADLEQNVGHNPGEGREVLSHASSTSPKLPEHSRNAVKESEDDSSMVLRTSSYSSLDCKSWPSESKGLASLCLSASMTDKPLHGQQKEAWHYAIGGNQTICQKTTIRSNPNRNVINPLSFFSSENSVNDEGEYNIFDDIL